MKEEMRAEDRTTMAAQDNNPLKVMSDVQEALGYLIDSEARKGPFLPPLRAVQDACEDLRTHQLALMAAMRVAIMAAIDRFDPAMLEKLLTGSEPASRSTARRISGTFSLPTRRISPGSQATHQPGVRRGDSSKPTARR
jgi:predicted component of type VI protein secretion system